MPKLNMVQAINLALKEEMQRDKNVVLLGEDVGKDGGVFRITEGLIDEFGAERVIDTPLAESVIAGAAIGMALYGLKPVADSVHGIYISCNRPDILSCIKNTLTFKRKIHMPSCYKDSIRSRD